MRRLIPLVLVVLAGCTSMQWVRPGSTLDELNLDLAYCRQEAWREAQWRSFSFLNRSVGATTIVDSRGRRIVVPYSPFGDPFGDAYLEEWRLAHFCMRARGYELVPIESDKASQSSTIQRGAGQWLGRDDPAFPAVDFPWQAEIDVSLQPGPMGLGSAKHGIEPVAAGMKQSLS